MPSAGEWEPDAENWVRWARTPGHDAYWYYRDGFFDEFVPGPTGRALEVGCGEGRVARDLAARGHRVTAIDTSHTLVRYARDEDDRGRYALADSAALPFRNCCFDLAVAYNALQVVADMAATVAEIARVLERGGHLCACIAHPVTDLGRFDTRENGTTFTLRDGYFENARVDDTVESNGLSMTFRGWTYSVEDYSLAFEAAGLWIEGFREPRPTGAPSRYDRWQHVPQFMFIRAVKP
ncbi:MAG TPA: class I SAM-dependent methyltransferase [Acidimicrobiales bacterium]|nr:class I SAM-dependent methyltransferase [Acidimicrobiales bacterium]